MNGVEHLHPGTVRHDEVGDDHVVRIGASELVARRMNAVDDIDPIALPPKQNLQHLAQARLVVAH